MISSTGVQQGCNLGSLCYSAGALEILCAFQDKDPPVADVSIVVYIDDVVGLLPPGQSQKA